MVNRAMLAPLMARQYTLQRAPVAGPKIDYANELNEQQCAAVTAPPGAALVIAGAGSGKTRTLTYRVAYLIENGISPQLEAGGLGGEGALHFNPVARSRQAGLWSMVDCGW